MADLTEVEAQARAEAQLATGEPKVVIGGGSLESPSFWVFFYNTPEFWDGDDLAGLLGNYPIVVPKDGGPISYLTSVVDEPEDQLQALEDARSRS